MEQRTRRWSKALRSPAQKRGPERSGNAERRSEADAVNGERATTAVTRNSYRRGKDSEGWSVARKATRWDELPAPTPQLACQQRAEGQRRAKPEADSGGNTPGRPRGRGPGERCRHPGEGAGIGRPERTWTSVLGSRGSWPDAQRGGGDTAPNGVRSRTEGTTADEPETWRTPWLAAGCNRPARHCAE